MACACASQALVKEELEVCVCVCVCASQASVKEDLEVFLYLFGFTIFDCLAVVVICGDVCVYDTASGDTYHLLGTLLNVCSQNCDGIWVSLVVGCRMATCVFAGARASL